MSRQAVTTAGADPGDIHTWPTRGEVASRLGCTRIRVRQLEGRRLHPQVDEKGVHRFDEAEVRALELQRQAPRGTKRDRRTPGQLQAAMFALFQQGTSHRQIVITLEVTSDHVARAWEDYQLKYPPDVARHRRERELDLKRTTEEQADDEAWKRQMQQIEENNQKLVASLTEPKRKRARR